MAILNRATAAVDMKFPLAPESIIAYSRLPLTVIGVLNTVVDDVDARAWIVLHSRWLPLPRESTLFPKHR